MTSNVENFNPDPCLFCCFPCLFIISIFEYCCKACCMAILCIHPEQISSSNYTIDRNQQINTNLTIQPDPYDIEHNIVESKQETDTQPDSTY